MKLILLNTILSLIILFQMGCRPAEKQTKYYNGKIYTMNSQTPLISSFIVKNGRFITDQNIDTDEITDSIDLKGKTVLPGFIDAHGHLKNLGSWLLNIDLVGDSSVQKIQNKVKEFADKHPKMDVIKGRGWDQNLWKEKSFPTAAMLDAIISNRPVVLDRIDGHAIWTNSRAMKLAEITSLTPDPAGGKIIRDEKGNPTGVFVDNAEELIRKYLPVEMEKAETEYLKAAFMYLTDFGITGVHDAGTSLSEINILKKNLGSEWYNLRVYAMIDGNTSTWEYYRKKGIEVGLSDYRLTVRSIKLYADGALGSRGAMLLDSYSDDPSNKGLPVTSVEELENVTKQAIKSGFQVNIHAIGDAANRNAIDIFERNSPQDGINRRFRIEHAQVVSLDDIPRFKKNGIIASMQPTHATSDMPWAETRIGKERIKGGYAWRTFLKNDVKLALGSDFPVESVNPLLGIYAAYTRQDLKGKPDGGWYPDQRLTREEAVLGFTNWASYASFTDKIVGQIKTGQYADFIILSDNLFEVFPHEIPGIKVEQVYFGGKKVK